MPIGRFGWRAMLTRCQGVMMPKISRWICAVLLLEHGDLVRKSTG